MKFWSIFQLYPFCISEIGFPVHLQKLHTAPNFLEEYENEGDFLNIYNQNW